jgi:hypothetical protein
MDRNALVGKHLLQFAGLKHFSHDVATSENLTLKVKMRNRRPDGISHDGVNE